MTDSGPIAPAPDDRAFDVDPTAPQALAAQDPQALAARDAVEAHAQALAAAARQRLQREDAAAKAAAVAGNALTAAAVAAPPPAEAPFAPKHGSERWPVKTLNDADVGSLDAAVTATTVRELWKQERPGDMPLTYPVPAYQSRRAPGPETTIWKVTGTIIAHKWEQDGDFHLVLQDLDSASTMIVETPQSGSGADGEPFVGNACPDEYRARMEAARGALKERLNPSQRFNNASVKVAVTGPGFFDVMHGQNGVAATNAIEIHPILDVEFLD